MNTIKIFLRTDQLTKDGFHVVYLRITQRRRKKDFSLRIFVKPNDWNFNRNQVYKTDPQSIRKNKLIQKYKNKAYSIIDDAFFNDEILTFVDFEKQLFNKEYSDASFIDFVLDEIPKKNFSPESKRHYLAQVTKLQQFKKDLAFSDINLNFIKSYKEYMSCTLKNKLNTANKSLSRLKTFTNWAIEEKHMKENPFEKVKLKKEIVNREHLSFLELKKLEKLFEKQNLNYRQLNVLRYFLFVCYTGLRFTDVKNLKYCHIKQRYLNEDVAEFINLKMHKTGYDVSIPLIEKARKLMPKKITANQLVFRVLSNQKTNEYLKEIMKEAGIDKNITFHCARHTLGTNGLDMGIPIEVVSKILGHTEIKMTQIYAKVNDNLKYKEMLKLDKKSDENAA